MSVGASQAVSSSQIMQLVQNAMQGELEKISEKRAEKTGIEDKQLAYSNIDRIMEELQAVLLTLTKESSFSGRLASSSNPDVVTATASSSAARTSFTFSSITQLASAARIVTSGGSLGLAAGSAPYLLSDADINGVTDYNPNSAIKNGAQGLAAAIVSGTFTINGVSIDVQGTDTLYNILTKINNGGAGVVATFDAANDIVRISGTTIGADETITFNDGNTNFFTALDIDSVDSGEDAEVDKALNQVTVSGFNVITDGYFNINNHTFFVDVSEDSMDDIIRHVNNSNCGAVMIYDEDTGKVTVTNEEEGAPLILSNDTSHFLDALNVVNRTGDQDSDSDTSVYVGNKAQFTLNGEVMNKNSNTFTLGGVTFNLIGTTADSATVTVASNTDATIEHLQNFASQVNATISILDDKINEEGGPLERDSVLRRVRTKLRTEVLAKITNPGQYGRLVDVGFSFEKSGGKYTLTLDTDTLRSKLDEDETSVRQLFAYNNDSDGLLDDGGYAVSTRSYLKGLTRAVSGFFYERNDELADIIDRMGLKIMNMENDLIKKEERLFNSLVQSVQALQGLQTQGERVGQISSIIMNGMMTSSSSSL
ncbi:MAG: flagellar filament capping protein FliD [Candidatus Omnitrophica bacterium]|nr:flagellar filament capping protein FliD [Candidatus Omnitrophota bacterium]